MSRKLFAFLLSELETVRIVCKKCSAVTEMTTEKASGKFERPQCPVCGEMFYHVMSQDANPLFILLKMIQEMKRFSTFDVEFVLPDSDEPKPDSAKPKK